MQTRFKESSTQRFKFDAIINYGMQGILAYLKPL